MFGGTVRTIKTWGSGTLSRDVAPDGTVGDHEGALVVVFERASHVDRAQAAGLVGPHTRAFVPGAVDDVDSDGPVVLGYEGSLSDPGGDVQIGSQFFLQTQDYGTSEYLSLIGATLIRVVDETDFESFLDDADRAHAEGEILDFLTHPLTRLCDVPALGASARDLGPRLRLYVDAEGRVSTSPGGSVLGDVDDALTVLESRWSAANADSEHPCAVSLREVVAEDVRVAGLGSRPWLGAYHNAIAAVRDLRSRDLVQAEDVAVSGFGATLDPALAGAARPDLERGDAPVVLWSEESGYLYDPRADRTFQLGLPVARLAERLVVLGSVEDASTGADDADIAKVAQFFARADVAVVRS